MLAKFMEIKFKKMRHSSYVEKYKNYGKVFNL